MPSVRHGVTRRLLLAVAVLSALASLGAPAAATAQAQPGTSLTASPYSLFLPLVVRRGGLYWGAMVETNTPTTAALQPGGAIDTFETTTAGKRLAILHWGQPWHLGGVDQPFQTPYFENTRQHGSIPLLDWGSWDSTSGPSQPDFALSTITAGAHDAYLLQWARAAKAWGHPFFLRFDWEMNGWWLYPWAVQLNGNSPADFVAAWRHVHDLFVQAGATNATWVWCPNISSQTTTPYASLYPGDAYVDWTCLDGYNFYPTWLSFNTIFTGSGITWLLDSYHQVLAVAPAKPMMIGETASVEAGDGGALKAAWLTDALTVQLPANFPAIKAVVYFNWSTDPAHPSMPIESSPASSAAFRAAVGSGTYATNSYSALDVSPIPATP